MIFNSFQFLVFLPLAWAIHFALPHRARAFFLLVISYYFYMCAGPENIRLILAATAVNYLGAIFIERSARTSVRVGSLLVCMLVCFGMLFYYKYFDFTKRTINEVTEHFGGTPTLSVAEKILLPVGISFFTFQTVSYTIDVFRRQMKAEYNPIRFAAYVAFFPQLVAGPIERASQLLPQLNVEKRIAYDNIAIGFRWILMGLFKKMVIADTCGVLVQTIYGHPERFSGPVFILGALMFGFQVYGDFAGYSDIAIGVAKLFGFDLMVNFRQPFMARSVAEHWQRWHISLTSWFRDYVYLPMGGNRVSVPRWYFNVLFVFVTSGFWHGADWHFIAWGLYNGLLVLIQFTIAKPYSYIVKWTGLSKTRYLLPLLEWACTFVLVFYGYLFFRATSLRDALYMGMRFFDVSQFRMSDILLLGLQRFELAILFGWIVVLLLLDYCLAYRPAFAMSLWKQRTFRWLVYLGAIGAIAFFGAFDQAQFIYFAF